jgi:hypothetical protein
MTELATFQSMMNKLKLYSIPLFLFSSSLLINLTFPQLSWAKNVFEVSNVAVDVTAKAAAEARKQALVNGKTRAFHLLLKRLTLRIEHKALPKLTADEIDSYINDFSVSNEKTSPVRYLALLTFRFKPAAIRLFLNENGFSYAETLSKPVLVLPVFQTAGALILWDDPNPWREAWATRYKNQGLVPTILPLGDLADIAAIGAEQTMDGDLQRLNAIAKRYGAGDTLVVFGVLRVEAAKARRVLEVYINRYGRKFHEQTDVVTFGQKKNETLDDLLSRAVNEMALVVEDNWKRENLMQFSNFGIIPVTLSISELKEWILIRSRLNQVAVIRRAEMVLLSKDEVRLNLHFFGDTGQLVLALEQADLKLFQEDGSWVLAKESVSNSMVDKKQ